MSAVIENKRAKISLRHTMIEMGEDNFKTFNDLQRCSNCIENSFTTSTEKHKNIWDEKFLVTCIIVYLLITAVVVVFSVAFAALLLSKYVADICLLIVQRMEEVSSGSLANRWTQMNFLWYFRLTGVYFVRTQL